VSRWEESASLEFSCSKADLGQLRLGAQSGLRCVSGPVVCSHESELKADHGFSSSIYMTWQSTPQRQTGTNHLAFATFPKIQGPSQTLAHEPALSLLSPCTIFR